MTRDDSSIRPWIRILWQFTVFCGILWPVAVLAQESPAPPPDGMVLWLKSDTGVLTDGEGIITQWSDQSGNSNHAYGRIDPSAQTDLGPSVITGAVNGLPAVYFGLSSFLDLPNALDGAAAGEVFLVVKKDPISIPGASYSYGALFGDNQTYYPDGTGKVMDSMGFLSDLGKPTQDIFNYCIYNVSVGNGGKAAGFNGVRYFGQQTGSQYISFGSASELGCDQYWSATDSWHGFEGSFAEIIVYDRELSDADRAQVIAYLQQRYSLIVPPAIPTALAANNAGPRRISLSWTAGSADQYYYDLQRKAGSDSDFVTIATHVGQLSVIDHDVQMAAGSVYQYRVRAVNGLGDVSAFTDPVTVAYDPAAVVVPPGVDLQLWLKGNAGIVTDDQGRIIQWQDQSGNANDAAGTATVLTNDANGKPAVHFGQGESLSAPAFLAKAAMGEVFAVVKKDPLSILGAPYALGVLFGGDRTLYPNERGQIVDGMGLLTNTGKPTQDIFKYCLYGVSVGLTEKAVSFNGIKYYGKPLVPGSFSFGSNLRLGDDQYSGETGTYYGFEGAVAEILVYNRNLNDDERVQIAAYLQQKYAIIPPAAIPTALQARSAGAGRIALSWSAGSADQCLYDVERKTDGDPDYVPIATLVSQLALTDRDVHLPSGTIYSYRVRAINSLEDASAYSDAVSIAYDPTITAIPPADNMRLWLEADAGVVPDDQGRIKEWQDQSGNGSNAEARNDDYWGVYPPSLAANEVNAKPAVFFGNNNAFSLPSVLAGEPAGELFLVLKKNPITSDDYADFGGLGNLFGNGGTSYPNQFGEIDDGMGAQTNVGKPAQDIFKYSIYNVSADAARKTVRFNGVRFFDGDVAGEYFGFDNTISLGVRSFGEWNAPFNGEVAEMMVYNQVLDDAARNQVIEYLQQKYAVISPPAVPVSFAADVTLSGDVALHWAPGSGDQYLYDIQRKGDGDADFVTIAAGLTGSSYMDTAANLQPGVTYSYRVQAENGLSAVSAYGEPVSLTFNPPGLPIPSSGISLWLRADVGVVTQDVAGTAQVLAWRDQSGYGRDLLAPDLQYLPDLKQTDVNGLPAVHFPVQCRGLGTDGFVAGTQTGEFFVVVKKDAEGGWGGLGEFYQIGPPPNFSAWHQSVYGNEDGVITDNFLADNTQVVVPGLDLCSYHVYNVTAADSSWMARLNGILECESARTWSFGTSTSGRFHLGVDGDDSSNSLGGSVAEVIFYGRALTDGERAQLIAYLQARYAVIPAPQTPLNLQTHEALNGSHIYIDWQPAAGQAAVFEVQRKGPQDADFVTMATDLLKPFWRDTAGTPGNTYTYRVRAKNGVGAVSPFSNDATGALSGTAPIPIGGMRLWLRSDTAVITDTVGANDFVTAWCDQSGNGNDAVGSRSTSSLGPRRVTGGPNGVPAITLTSDSFSLPGFLNGAQQGELFLVLRRINFYSSGTLGSFHAGHVSQYPDDSGRIQDNFLSSTSHAFAPRASLGNYHVYNVASGPDGWAARVNGIPEFVSTDNVVSNSDSARCALGSTTYSLGYATNSSFDGAMIEAIFYDRVLSADERSKVQQYLQDRYAVVPDPAVPTALGGNAPLLASASEVRLEWQTGAAQEVVYEVQRKAAGDSDFATIATNLTQTSYVDSNVIAGSTYTYRIRAVNGLGVASDWGSEVVVAVPVRSTAVPDQGIRLWFRADSGVQMDASGNVLRWFDQSGCGNDATARLHDSWNSVQVVPNAVNGQSALGFVGQETLTIPNGVLQGGSAGEVFVFLKKDHYYDSTHDKVLWSGTYYPRSDGRISDGLGRGGQYAQFAPTQTIYDYHLYNVSVGSDWVARINGVEQYRDTIGQVQFGSLSLGCFGYNWYYSPPQFTGEVAEMLVYNRVLSAEERHAVENYFYGRYSQTLFAPNFSPLPGRFENQVTVTLGCATPNAEIYYSTDGSAPVPGVSARYSATLTFTESTQLNAIAFANGATSSLASGLFSIGIAPGAQTATSGFSATYYQTADFGGTTVRRIDPTIDFGEYWRSSCIPADTRSVRWTGTLTARFTEAYTFHIASQGQPRLWIGDTLVIDGLGQASAQELSGVVHLEAGQTYPVHLEYLPCYYPASGEHLSLSWSGLSTAEEVVPACQVSSGLPFGGTVATPVATPAGGAFVDTISVSLNAGSPAGARIYYTLDGSDPGATSALYTAPIVLRQSATIKAFASASGFNDSGVLAASYTLDTAAPVLSNLTFNGAPVPASITTNGAFGITATSNVGVRRVDFRLDGQLIGSSTVPAAGFTAQFSIGSVLDGTHALTVQAWDVAGKPSDVLTTTIQVALPAPIPPVITSPNDGKKVNVSALTVRGTAASLTTVRLYVGAGLVGSTTAAADGSFSFAITLNAGANAIYATAQNRNPQPSSPSAVVTVTYDNTVPAPPTALSARALAGGKIGLTWYPPASGLASGYYLFRSTAPIPAGTALSLADAIGAMVHGQSFTDTPPADGHYYYRAVTGYSVGDGTTLSDPSNQADAVSDGTAPSATASLQAIGPFYDAAGHRFGVGLVQATLTVSEPLGATPFFNLAVAGGSPVFVDLTPQGGNVYQGVFSITSSTSSGVVSPVFSAVDLAGNRGATVTLTTPAVIDTLGPRVIGLTPVSITDSGALKDLPELKAIKNDPVPPATAVSVSWRLALDEAPKAGAIPAVTATLSGDPDHPLTLTVTDAGDSDPLTWLAQLALPADAGVETQSLTLHFAASDDLNNLGQDILPPHSFQVYKGDLPPLAVPIGFTATTLPAGAIDLTWQAVPGAAACEIQYRGPGDADFNDLTMAAGDATDYRYTPAADGAYSYRIASVRTANGQASVSGWSAVVTARSDRVPPDAPAGLALEVVPQGVKASWDPPATHADDVAGYALYRSPAAITSVAGLDPAVAQISAAATLAVDPRPDGTQPFYALIAFDQAGNQSPPVFGFANVGLLPVRSIAVAQVDSSSPVLSWEMAPGSIIDGYNLSVGDLPISLNGSTLIPVDTLSYTDSGYTAGDRLYTVATVSGPDSSERSLTLPNLTLTLDSEAGIKRGLMNTLMVTVRNNSAQPVTDARLLVELAGRTHSAADLVTVAAGAEQAVPVVVGGYDDLTAGTAAAGLTLVVSPNEGESATLQRSASVQVTEGALAAEILPGELTRGGSGQVRFKLTNPSSLPIEFKVAGQQGAQASGEVRLKVLDLQGSLLSSTPLLIAMGDDVVALPDGTVIVRVPAGASYTSPVVSLPVPASAPALVNVALEIDSVYYHFGQGDTQVTLKGPQALQQVSTIETPYLAEVTSISPVESNGDRPIVVLGRALWRGVDPASSSAPAGDVKVVVTISLDGFIRQQSVLTGTDGSFAYTFQPDPAEKGGVYQVWAAHPDLTQAPDTPATFTIRRVTVSPQSFDLRTPRNYRQAIPVGVLAGAGTTVQNLRAVLAVPLPAAVSVDTPTVSVLAPGQNITLPLTIVGLAPTTTSSDTGTLIFHVVSDDGAGGQTTWADITVSYTFSAAKPYLQATPTLTEIGVQPGQVASGTVALTNQGLAPLADATASLVSADATALPAWIRLQTPAALGTIDIGAGQSVIISAAPPVDGQLIDVVYHFYLHVQGSDPAAAAGQDFPVSVTVSPGGKGGALLKIVDPYYQLTLPDGATNAAFNGLSGASVVLEKESSTGVPTITQGATTDTNGEVSFSDLPAGSYKLRINADRHEPDISRIVIKPGVIYADQIPLAYSPVTFTWEVVPVTFQDRYDVVLTATYETNVPVPVVVIEPASINLPKMCAGQVFAGEFKITNHGLVDAHDVSVPVPATDANFSYELLSSFGDTVKAGQTVTVSYRVKCLKPLPGACPATADDSPHFWSRFIASLGGGNGGPNAPTGGPSSASVGGTGVSAAGDSGSAFRAALFGQSGNWPLALGCSALGVALFAGILYLVNPRPCEKARARCTCSGKPSDSIRSLRLLRRFSSDRMPSIPARLVFVIRLVLVAEFGLALPPGATADGDGGCGTYASCISVSFYFVGACGIKYMGSGSVCIYSVYGGCAGGGGSGTGYPTPVGVGNGGPGSPSGWQGSGGGSASGKKCSQKPQQRCDLPGDNPDARKDCRGKNDPARRNECNGVFQPGGSWVDLVQGQFRDNATDLMVPVPGGEVAVWRNFNRSRWRFRMIDDLHVLNAGPIYLNGDTYDSPTKASAGTVVGYASAESGEGGGDGGAMAAPSVNSVAVMPAGVYSSFGVGPAQLVKSADGTLLWTDGSGYERHYDASGKLVERRYRGLLVATYRYDENARLSTIADRNGRTVLTFTYAGGLLTEAHDFTGRSVTYGYDSAGRLTSVTDPLGTQTTYAYGDTWEITEKRTHISGTSPDTDHRVSIAYQSRSPATPPELLDAYSDWIFTPRTVKSITHDTGESETFVFGSNDGDQTFYAQVTNSTGQVDESVFNAAGVLVAKHVNGDQVLTMQEDATTRVTTLGGNQNTTEEFDSQGYLLRRTSPDGGVESFEYDRDLGKRTRYTDPLGVVTAYSYDSLGNELIKTEAVGTSLERVTTSEYFPGTTLLKRETDPSGRAHAYEYDAADQVTGIYDPANTADQVAYTYDALGNRQTETDALGRVTTYQYDAVGHVTRQIDPLLQETVFTYSGNRLDQVETGRTSTAPGRIVRFEYDSAGRKTKDKRVATDGTETIFRTFAYDADGRLLSETNALGQTMSYTYDAAGNQSGITVPGADGSLVSARTTCDLLQRPVESVDAAGSRTTVHYDLRDRPISVTDGVGTAIARTTSTRYDLLGRTLEIDQTDAREPARTYTTTFAYDVLGRRTSIGGDRVYPVTYTYDAVSRVSTETDALGRVRSYDYDTHDRMTAVGLNGVTVQSRVYDLAGNCIQITDGEGNHRHFHYDALNRLTEKSVPLGIGDAISGDWWTNPTYVRQAATYTAWGEPATVLRYTTNGPQITAATTSFTYDEFGRKTGQTDPGGLTRIFASDAADNPVEVDYPAVASSGELKGTSEWLIRSPFNASIVLGMVDRAGNRTGFGYDKALRVNSETNSLGGVTQRTFDAFGRVASETDPAGNATGYTNDLFDQPVQIVYPDHVASTHERIATFRYDNAGKLLEKSGAGDYPMTYAYDAVGNLVSMTDGNNHETRWSYESHDLVSAKRYADGSFWSYTYDNAGRMITRVDAIGRTTKYGYDASGLLTGITYPTDPAVGFIYDQQGRRLNMTDGSGSTTWTYDAAGRMVSETQARSHRTVNYSYDAFSNRTGLLVQSTGASEADWRTDYGYDNAGRLHTVLDDRLSEGRPYVYAYASNASLVEQIETPTGLKTIRNFDNFGRIQTVSMHATGSSLLASFSYTYDSAGQRVTETAPERARAFTYDALRQLTQSAAIAVDPQLAATDDYAYDLIGNRTQVGRAVPGVPPSTTIYATNTVNQYTALTGATVDSPAYDLNGNTVASASALQSPGGGGSTLNLRYDEENRLVEASNTVHRSMYIYDGLGRRVETVDDDWSSAIGDWSFAALRRSVYDGWRAIEETDANGATLRSYTRGLDLSGTFEGAGGIGGLLALSLPAAAGSGFTTASYFHDGNGNVTDLFNDDGTSAAHYVYSPFGDRLTATGPLADVNPYQFSSKERDPLAGFYYYGLRFYNPATGRWLSRDPIKERGGVNLYGMVKNSPVSYFDPLGCESIFCCQLKRALEHARLAKAAYPGETVPAGWEKVDAFKEFNIPEQLLNNPSIGYESTVFRNPSTGEYVISFAGTDDLKDFPYANIPQNFGVKAPQYERAAQLGNILGREIPSINFVGHSLGGGLASAALSNSSTTGRGYIYNAAGLNRRTLDINGGDYDRMASKTEHWNYMDDPLTMAEAEGLIVPAAGTWIGVNNIDEAHSLREKHSIDTLIKSLEQEIAKLGCK